MLGSVLARPGVTALVLGSACSGACAPPVLTYPPVHEAAPRGPHGPLMPRQVREELPKICSSIDVAWFEVAIDAHGAVEEMTLIDATTETFGAAASDVLRKLGKWRPAVDQDGSNVAARTPVRLSCTACATPLCGNLQLPGEGGG
jgi:hypothetical protein